MKIEIKVDGFDKEEILTLTDEQLDNDNFVEIYLGEEEYTVPIDDLVVAAQAFVHTRTLRVEREKGYA